MIFAVDFDGTLANTTPFPTITSPVCDMVAYCKKLRESGHKLILNTCRTGERLDEAVEYCKSLGLVFDAVNENLPEQIAKWGGDCRKISADYYIDDRNLHPMDLVQKDLKHQMWWDWIKK